MATPSPGHQLPARRALADEVHDAILALLMDQVLEPGSRASIDGLARDLGVSPTPVREALARLESEGLVIKQALKGYTVTPLLDAEGLQELHQMRRLLEPEAARGAAVALDTDALAELASVCEQMRTSTDQTGQERFQDYREFASLDAQFHAIIAAQCGNSLLADAIGRLRTHTQQYRLYFKHAVTKATLREHDAILAALQQQDAKAAAKAMERHVTKAYRRIAASLEPPG